MIYGSNILSSVATDWEVTNGAVTAETITLGANGSAMQHISLTTLPKIPEVFMVSIVASTYANPYELSIVAIIEVESPAGNILRYHVPVVDTGGGVCTVEIPTTTLEHAALNFILQTNVDVTFTSLGLFPPKASDVDLTEIIEKIPRLLKDYNVAPMTVTDKEDTIAMICSYVTTDTELTGHVTLSYTAAANTTLVIRIKDNETSELYTPMTICIAQGTGTIGIPHAYLNLEKGYHNFTVTAQVLSGTIQLDTRKVSYVIDGGNLVESLSDVGSIVYDITAKKLENEEKLSEVYAVCIDNGQCTVKKCQYTEVPGFAWVSVATLGEAIDAAIEFNGFWNLNTVPYTFNTEAAPWAAWVTPGNILKAQRIDDPTTLAQLSTGVTAVAMIKGWDNTKDDNKDQGVLAGYIKSDGLVYYRGYCRLPDNSYAWDTEYNLTEFTGTATDITLTRTNDYRVGISVLDSPGVTHTYITARNWPGMSVPSDTFLSGDITSVSIQMHTVEYLVVDNSPNAETLGSGDISYGLINLDGVSATALSTVVSVTLAQRTDARHYTLTLSHPAQIPCPDDFVLGGLSTQYPLSAVSVSGNNVNITTSVDTPLIGFSVDLKAGQILGVVNSHCRNFVAAQNIAVMGSAPPVEETLIGGDITSLTITPHTLEFISVAQGVADTFLSGDITSVTVTLSKVGNTPL